MTINNFLKSIADDMMHMHKEYSADDIYYMLKYLEVDSNTMYQADIDKFYQEFLVNLGNSLVRYEAKTIGKKENATHYIGFYVDKKADYKEAVKVYFPVKYEYLISALKTTFMYLVRNNVKATVKFHVKATNEGIVIRFYDKKDAMPFINYCNNNFLLRDLLEKVNPFIATVYGIGVLADDNTVNTYNGTLSEMLSEYFLLLSNNGTMNNASDLDFLDYIIKRGNIEEDESIKFNIKAIEKNIRSILSRKNPLEEKDLI